MLSISAIGTIDKKLIYRKRIGFDDVKRYTKTVNPDMPKQKTQKGYFKEAINEWQTAGYSSFDVQAWDLYARSKKVIASGFNRFTGLKINAEKEGKTWNKLTNCIIYDITAEGFKVDINVESDLSGILYLGTSKFSMLEEIEGTFTINKYTFVITGLSKQTRYYFYIKNTSGNAGGRSGIYSKKTEVRVPIIIDIGAPAIDRGSSEASYTFISKDNPANLSGKITTVEIWANLLMTSCKVGIFEEVDTNTFTTRDWTTIGTVTEGSKQTFPGLDLAVEAGDYIGIWYYGGRVELDASGGAGIWFENSDKIPCTDYTFSFAAGYIISVYGTGIG